MVATELARVWLEDSVQGDHQVDHFDRTGNFLLISIALGTFVGRLQFKGFSIGATACTLVVTALLGQLGTFVIPPLFKSIFFSLSVLRSAINWGPILCFAELAHPVAGRCGPGYRRHRPDARSRFRVCLSSGSRHGCRSCVGQPHQSSMIGPATSALSQLGVADDVLRQQQANIAAGYAVTYILGYILTLLSSLRALADGVPQEEAAKLEATLSGGKARKAGSLSNQRFKARPIGSRPPPGRPWAHWKIASASVSSSNASNAAAATSTVRGRRFSQAEMKSCSPDRRRPSSRPAFRSARKSKASRCFARYLAMRSAFSSAIRSSTAGPWREIAD